MLFVGEAPGEDEDRTGRPFVGRSGQLLDRYLVEVGIDRATVGVCNVLRCRPPGNRDPFPEEAEACRRWLLADLIRYRPRTIVALGKYAAAFFSGTPIEEVRITKIRGKVLEWTHPDDPRYRADVLLTLHPAFVAREEHVPDSMTPDLFRADLCAAQTITVGESESLPSNTGVRLRRDFMPETRFVTGWHVGHRVFLLRRDRDGRHVLERIAPDWYFLIRSEDLTPKARDVLSRAIVRGIPYGKHDRYRIRKVARDEIDGWVRVYPEVPDRWVSRDVKRGMLPDESGRFTTVSPFLPLARYFGAIGVRTFEADVDPLRRFLTDHVVTMEQDGLRLLWLDIETDDEAMPGRPVGEIIGKVPILSIGCQLDDGRTAYMRAESTAPHHERDLLEWFFHGIVPTIDMAVAWNGAEFDFPFLFARARLHHVRIAPQATMWWDALYSFKKHHRWDAGSIQSYSLDNVSAALLGDRKEKRTRSVKSLWRDDPDALRTYNVKDVELLRRIEVQTGYVRADVMQNVVSNNFPGNTYVGLRIDGLVLAEGYRRGTHFRTKHIGADQDAEQFVGAFVLDPVLGRHDNVANFDFASLYPSVFTTWNISPDTFVPAADVPARDPAALTRCPRFDVEGVPQGGECFLRSPLGIIPTIYVQVAERRAHYKRAMRDVPPLSPEWMRLKRLEYVWKTLGLSMYGTMGSVFARIYNRAVAQSVTLTAQFLTRATLALAERLGFRPIYGDTDSCFVGVQDEARDVPLLLAEARALYRFIGDRYGCEVNRIELEHEQTFDRVFFFAKKRYFGRLRSQKGKPVAADAPLEIKGLEVRRSDGVKYARTVQERMIGGIVDGWGVEDARRYLGEIRERVFGLKLTPDELAATAGLTKDPAAYRSTPVHVRVAERMIAAGEEVFVGQKIAFIVTDGSRSPMEAVPISAFDGRYDANHYWNKKIWPPIQRLVEVLWPDQDWAAMKVRRPPKPRRARSADPVADVTHDPVQGR